MEGLISSVCKVNRCPPPSFKPPHQSQFSVTKVLRRSSSMTCPVVLSHRTPFHWQQSSPRHEERRPEGSKKLFLKDVSAFRSLGTQIPPTAPGVVVVFARSKGEADCAWKTRKNRSTAVVAVAPCARSLGGAVMLKGFWSTTISVQMSCRLCKILCYIVIFTSITLFILESWTDHQDRCTAIYRWFYKSMSSPSLCFLPSEDDSQVFHRPTTVSSPLSSSGIVTRFLFFFFFKKKNSHTLLNVRIYTVIVSLMLIISRNYLSEKKYK